MASRLALIPPGQDVRVNRNERYHSYRTRSFQIQNGKGSSSPAEQQIRKQSKLNVLQCDVIITGLTLIYPVFQVVYGVGLCIILFDVTFVGDPYVIHGTGASHTRGMYVTSSV